MWISRIRVNGGFLAGVDVRLQPGLNVVVGPRGAGKTTLLELVRHALGIHHADEGESRRRQDAIAALLGPGEVVLELQHEHSSRHLVVDAAGGGRSPETALFALALGQNELERIASNSSSRLNLIDLRASVDAEPPSIESAIALTGQLAAARVEIGRLFEAASRRAVLEADRAEASAEETALLKETAADVSSRREVLRAIESELLQLTTESDIATTALSSVQETRRLAIALERSVDEIAPRDAGAVVSALLEPRVESMRDVLASLSSKLDDLDTVLRDSQADITERKNSLRLRAEPVRAELEAAEAGLGQVTARLRNIDSELAHLARADALLTERQLGLVELKRERDALLDEFEVWQESLFEARLRIADTVSADLESRVAVIVEHLADTSRFRNLLNDSLHGSGLQYRSLSDAISKTLLPRQLMTLIEGGDADGLAKAVGIPMERAARVIAHLAAPEILSALSVCTLDDRVDFRLRDGARYKSVEDLSTGQKCAVTLPIVLTELSRVLILDQPEDHLDNAYLVDHVVRALQRRGTHRAQTIVATHNANIPVLGSAPMVISLGSDGSRGFIEHSGPFDDDSIVAVITSLMEGGREAFRRRAEFYAEHGASSE